MVCDNCKSDKAHVIRGLYTPSGIFYSCNVCDDIKASPLYDVYLGMSGGIQTDPNLVDPKTGKEIPFSTKGEKRAIMQRLGLKQSVLAERQHGSRREEFKKRTFFT